VTRRPRRGLIGPVALAALAALAGCSGAPSQLAGASTAAPAPVPAPAPSSVPPAAPVTPAVAPVWSAVPPAGVAGLLAAVSPPPGVAGTSFAVWFAGVPVGQDGDRLVVAYPSMSASSDGRKTVAHAKVAVFRCERRVGRNFAGCHRRAVEYGDLAAPGARLLRHADGTVTVGGRFPTYAYGTGVDRHPKVRPHWTGRSYLIQVDLQPSGPGSTTLVPVDGTVTLGAGAGAVTAGLDLRYPNQVRPPR